MSGTVGARVAPLRPGDPDVLGEYELTARLGQGGMGTVYLARDRYGDPVAVKVVRADLAADDEFRQRFRSEVHRARQVPPFCTAEVLDADPDHETPYLVVEFVDGPSLAEVVDERGPLSPANLHALAIGVATALTAIHGAGVVHRDLKPRNVLLAPGSPKVIDFGIARAMEATSQLTRTNQMLGTVAYMAPERFDADSRTPLGPPADVFAWGAVIAYAGTGRTPFQADSPPATAARILTQPPELTGLPEQLRGLVELTLAKDPEDRPTARELLDLLLGSGPQAATAHAALTRQPELGDAASNARAISDERMTIGHRPRSARRTRNRSGVDAPPGHRRRSSRATVLVPLALAVVLAAAGGPYVLDRLAVADAGAQAGAPAATASASGTAAGTATVPSPPARSAAPPPPVRLQDTLAKPGKFKALELEQGNCRFQNTILVVNLLAPGSMRCPGPPDLMVGDRRVAVDVMLGRDGSCASIWFASSPVEGYSLSTCSDSVVLDLHRESGSERVGAATMDPPLPLGRPARMAVQVEQATLTISRDGSEVAQMPLDAQDLLQRPTDMTLGVLGDPPAGKPPYQVAFGHVDVRS